MYHVYVYDTQRFFPIYEQFSEQAQLINLVKLSNQQ